jgi:hypothetical protein
VLAWGPVAGGHTHARSWRADTSRRRAFVKTAEEPSAYRMLVNEIRVFASVEAPFLPRAYGWRDDGAGTAVLAIEDLSAARWPPPYPGDVRPLFAALDGVAATEPPDGVLTELHVRPPQGLWRQIADDPSRLLRRGLCTETWLTEALPVLVEAEAAAVLEGEDLVHNDVYSGNVCFLDGRALLVDWALAARGNRWFDVACAALSVRSEGARLPPIDIVDAGPMLTVLAGHHAVHATAPTPAWARGDTGLLEGHLQDLRAALPWVAELLGLPPPRSLDAA